MELQTGLAAKIREHGRIKRQIGHLEEDRREDCERFGVEYDTLISMEQVKELTIDDGTVKVITDLLYCVDPRSKKRHEIGAFRIEISRNASNGGVRWYNLTRRVDGIEPGMHAPHVFPQGKGCLGSISELLPDLIAKHEYAALVTVAIQFIEQVNVQDGAGAKIHLWPEAAANIPAEQEAATV